MINKFEFKIDELSSMKKYPQELFYIGNINLINKRKISIVGTRKPFNITQLLTHQLSQKLSNVGICIVSGGATGVDTIAHRAASVNNTIIVSPCGLNIRYPAINKKLIEDIEKNGLVISAYKENTPATKWSFVQRNEIVVSLGEILIVTQADLNSGSLRSVEFAKKMGKEIYVLPHRIGESEGTNQLLKSGIAKAIYDIDEFVSKFGNIENKIIQKDKFLEYCKTNPNYDEVFNKYSNKLFEYELEGKIEIVQGKVRVL